MARFQDCLSVAAAACRAIDVTATWFYGQRCQHGDGLERRARAVRDIIAKRQLVREEDRIEQPRFRLLRQGLVVADIGQRQRRSRGVPPGRLVVTATVDEQIQVYVAFHLLPSTV